MYGPKTEFSQHLHKTKYRLENETFEEWAHRISDSLFPHEEEKYHKMSDILKNQRFMPGGRISVALGNSNKLTPFNCFVSSQLSDNLESIWSILTEAGRILSMGGGVGYDFSPLRPSGSKVSSVNGPAGGPVNFMKLFNTQGEIMASTGGRRSAQMGVLRIDHPDIESFIRAKQDGTSLSAFNLSVGVTNKFMRAVEKDEPFDLTFNGRVYKTVSARSLWNLIMRSTWDWAEPGVLFLDTINENNNLNYCETISATNPCGEQVLPPSNCCLLGSFNLTKYIKDDLIFNWLSFANDIPLVVEAYDNLIDSAVYPTQEQRYEQRSKRRIGLGITGLANAGEILGYPYGSVVFLQFAETVMKVLRNRTYMASIELSKERGQFEALDGHVEDYLSSPYIQNNISGEMIDTIRETGIRNSHLISIAPTGTMSLCADNISSGIEPVFSYTYDRAVNDQIIEVSDYAYKFYDVKGKTSNEVSLDEHLAVLALIQKYVDSSVSKTINVPNETKWDDFKEVYFKAWKYGIKGVTTFRSEGKRSGILSCKYDPVTGERSCE